jgi:hypothetical protein
MVSYALMNVPFLRSAGALGALALLAGCSGVSPVPPALAPIGAPGVIQMQSSASPCAVQYGYTFEGPCHEFKLRPAGRTVTFQTYHGLDAIVRVSRYNSSDGQPLVLGLGTSDADITGKAFGTKFPEYGTSGGCFDVHFKTVKCRGKAFLYLLIYQPPTDAWGTGFEYMPSVHFANSGAYPGTQCQESYVTYVGKKTWKWQELITATPHNGAISFRTFPFNLALEQGAFAVLGFHCW